MPTEANTHKAGRGSLSGKTVLVTGAARRIGAAIATACHDAGATVAVHYRGSADEANALVASLNETRANSSFSLSADLLESTAPERLVADLVERTGRLDLLVNNASSFYPTPVGEIDDDAWEDLIGTNLRAPLFLSQAAAPLLRETGGSIVNLLDIHAATPAPRHTVYCMAKAGLSMMTRSLALELAPEIRVNGIAPGAILWPDNGMSDKQKASVTRRIPLGHPGDAEDVAKLVVFLAAEATYITGQIIAVDGGQSVRSDT